MAAIEDARSSRASATGGVRKGTAGDEMIIMIIIILIIIVVIVIVIVTVIVIVIVIMLLLLLLMMIIIIVIANGVSTNAVTAFLFMFFDRDFLGTNLSKSVNIC